MMRTDKPRQVPQDSFLTEESLTQEKGAEVDASPMIVVLQPQVEEVVPPTTIKEEAKANIRKKILGLARRMKDTGVDPLQGFVAPELDAKQDDMLPLSLELSPTLDDGDQAPAEEAPKIIVAKVDK